MDHYGQFPGNYGPFRTLMAFQAHHIDTAFYDRFYVDGAYTDLHARHFELWHAGEPGVGARTGAGAAGAPQPSARGHRQQPERGALRIADDRHPAAREVHRRDELAATRFERQPGTPRRRRPR